MIDEAAAFLRQRWQPLKLVIFDCDGVLIDSEGLSNRVATHMLAEAGWHMGFEECERRFVGFSFSAVQALAEAHLGRSLGADWVARVVARVVDVMRQEAVPIPGAREALDAVTALGLPWRIASNSSLLEMNAKFGRTGWLDLVAGRVHSAANGRGKPLPDVFLAAARAEMMDPEHCLVIEDSVAGASGARAAGMACLGFAPHGGGAELRDAGAAVFRSMHHLPTLIRTALEA